jgi:hypothetical protein
MICRLVSSAALLFCIVSTGAAQTPDIIDKNATVLGFNMHYLESGRGRPVVLLHGLGGDGSRWTPNIGPLAADFRIIALDPPQPANLRQPAISRYTSWAAEFPPGGPVTLR